MDVVFWIIAILTVLALVGHGIWVLIGAFFRGMSRLFGSIDRRPTRAEICPRCGEAWDHRRASHECSLCGWPQVDSTSRLRARPREVLANLRRRVERYHHLGLLPTEIRDRLDQAFQVEAGPTSVRAEEPRPEAAPAAIHFLEAPVPEVVPPVEALAPAAEVATRFSAYRASREEGPGPASAAVEKPQRVLTLLATFLEESNIRWGELVGGLLIVGCSLALVISFWSSIAERPFLKFGLFNGVTALLFALGHHAERRWRLPTTALGLLVIATLLTPLNFLAVASLVRGGPADSVWGVAGEFVVAGFFAALTYRAGRTLVTRAPTALVVGVLVPSIAMLLIRRFVGPGVGSSVLLALGALPVVAQLGAVGGLVLRVRREPEIGEDSAHDLLRLLGLSTFAGSLAVGLLLSLAGPVAMAFHRLAPLMPLAGTSSLAAGLLLWRRTTAPALVGYRTAGTAIAAGGVLVMLAGVALGWPDPSGMLPVALLNFAVLTAIALAFNVPAAHALAGACLTLAYLLGWLVATGGLGWDVSSSDDSAKALLSARSGAALVPMVLLFGGAAAAGLRFGRRLDAQAYAMVGGLAGALSVGLVSWHGLGRPADPAGATWVYAAYALAAIAGAGWSVQYPLVAGTSGRIETSALAWTGSALALASLVQGLVFGGWTPGLALPWVAAMLAHATLATFATLASALLAIRRREQGSSGTIISEVLTRSALATSAVAAGWLVVAVPWADRATLSVQMGWLSIVWLIQAGWVASPGLFAACQAALTGAVVFGVARDLQEHAWYVSSPHPWLDPRMIQAQAFRLGVMALLWIGLRLKARKGKGETVDLLYNPPWPAFDRYVRGAVILAVVALAVYGVMPGVAQELTPRDLASRLQNPPVAVRSRVVPPATAFELAGIPHGPALGGASWALLVVALAVLLAGQWERFRRVDLIGALVVGSMAAPLAAGWWEPQVASASALRWTGALALLAGSALVWSRDRLAGWSARLGWRIEPEHLGGLEGTVTATVLALAALPLAAMVCYVAIAAVSSRTLGPDQVELLEWVGAVFILLAGVGVVFRLVPEPPRAWVRPGGVLLVLLGTLPVVAVSVYVVASALAGNPIVGPEPGSVFARLGKAGSYVPPMLLVAATLIGFAVRERSSGFAFAAGVVLNVAATVGYLLAGARGGLVFDAVLATRLAQLNAIVAAGYALTWMGTVFAWRRRLGDEATETDEDNGLLGILISLAVALNLIVLAAGILALFLDPVPGPFHQAIAGIWGCEALVLAVGAVIVRARGTDLPIAPDWLGLSMVVAADFFALGLVFQDSGNWLAYHGLIAGEAVAGGLLLLLIWHGSGLRLDEVSEDRRAAGTRWAYLALGMVVFFAVRAYESDPQSPWWTVGGLVCMVPLAGALAVWARRPDLLYLGGVLLNLAAMFWWFDAPLWMTGSRWPTPVDLLNLNVVALALPAPVWLWVDRRWLRRERAELGRDRPWLVRFDHMPFPRFAAWAPLAALAFVVVAGLADDAVQGGAEPNVVLGWLALASAMVAMAAGLWDERSRGSVAGLYLLGLCASGWAVHQYHLPPRMLVWTGTMVLSAYSVATSFLWVRRDALRAWADRLGIPDLGVHDAITRQLVPANLTLAAWVLALAFGTILTEDDALLRSSAATAAMAEVLAIGMLAQGERRQRLQSIALGVGVVGATAWGWAGIAPDSPTGVLDRLVFALLALAGAGLLYGIGLVKLFPRETEWTLAARRLVPGLLGLAGLMLAVVLGVELAEQVEWGGVAISAPAIAAVAFALTAASAAAMVAALVPGRDPLGLTEQGRSVYVYGCEVMLALLGAHLRLTLPWIFTGFFVRWWPLIVMGLAFLGVGLSELFRRQGRFVLSGPLERTGAILPILPLVNGLITGPKPGEDVLFLVLVGGLYTMLSVLRTSLGFGALAALAYNGALWTVLGRWEGHGFFQHPQLWAISPAFCVLVGGHLNRDRLSEAQTASIRYGATLVIYLSSTADIVLTGVAQAPWLPLVLAALSIAGIFAGIVLRVRGFLFVGIGFLTLALFTVVWYAAVDLRQTWIWSACGIVTGVLILALFALFEKKRNEVLRVVDSLKEWHP